MHLDLGALVDVAMEWLVAVIGTVRHLVAHALVLYALAVVATELALGTRRLVSSAIELIRIIPTVVFPVTAIRVAYALEVLTGELLRTTRLVPGVTLLSFVGSIPAVVVMIAGPSLVDAASVGASELFRSTRGWRRTIQRRCVLISTVHTVWITIAQPLPRNALCAAPCLVRRTCELCLVVTASVVTLMPCIFVRVVHTVIVSITNVDPRYAVAIIAGEQVTEARSSFRFAVLRRLV